MAERRMFSKAIIGSARFLRMPATSRLLYYDMGMDADDDGCVEAFSVMRKTGANDDDLRVLVSKGFVRVLNEDLVSLILDWRTNNYIQKDRYHPSIYAKLIDQPPLDTECIQDVSKMDTQVRLGKVSIGKVSIDKERIGDEGADKPPTHHKHGEYKNVLLSDDELEKLKAEIPGYEQIIERLSEYIASSGKQYKNHYATIRAWNRKDGEKNHGKNELQFAGRIGTVV